MPQMTITPDELARICSDLDEASDDDRNRRVNALAHRARADRAAFVDAARSLPLTPHSGLFWIYEAVATEANDWKQFIVEEVGRLLMCVEAESLGSDVLTTLEALGTINDDSVRSEVKTVVLSHASSQSARVRRCVATLLGDFADAIDETAKAILVSYLSDGDWRVRVLARQTLNEWSDRPLDDGLPLLDRIWKQFSSEYSWA